MSSLVNRSIEIILNNQSESGAYIACPNFPTYHYCWLRDGSFIANSMDLVGEHQSARAFFQWVDTVIQRYTWKIDRILEKRNSGVLLQESDYLHTRYTLSGEEAAGDWLNFQLDGYGSWLWALSEHMERTHDVSLLENLANSVQKTVSYLTAVWDYPNYDCWEENPHHLHPYTLAAIYSGITSAKKMADISPALDLAEHPLDLSKTIRQYTLDHAVKNGLLQKSFPPPGKHQEGDNFHPDGVDASLLGLAIPYRMLDPSDPLIRTSVARIESDLRCNRGGVYRYLADTYYGGGEWLLLAAWLGWYYAETGDIDQAEELRHWVEDQADPSGQMPEQVSSHLLSPSHYEEWEKRWGPIANPLLWSHAMYIILEKAIQEST
jgi:GH15 family glucan-1,4-alpha-glucosidase